LEGTSRTASADAWQRPVFVAMGSLCLAIGIVGIVVPIVPTTPLLLLAAACYARGSSRFYRWLLGSRYLGDYIRSYSEGRGLPLQAKALTVIFLWAGIAYSSLTVDIYLVRILLTVIGLGVTVHLVTIPTPRG
jgi:uncharacterized protein